jgi:hypothetical protein
MKEADWERFTSCMALDDSELLTAVNSMVEYVVSTGTCIPRSSTRPRRVPVRGGQANAAMLFVLENRL